MQILEARVEVRRSHVIAAQPVPAVAPEMIAPFPRETSHNRSPVQGVESLTNDRPLGLQRLTFSQIDRDKRHGILLSVSDAGEP
jgi:hypothetical protein